MRTAAITLFAVLAFAIPRHGWSFFCRFPTQKLVGIASGSRDLRLDLTLQLFGPECDVTLKRGRLTCRKPGARTFGLEYPAPARRGKCPGPGGRVTDLVYESRGVPPAIADVSMTANMGNGVTCTITGETARFFLPGVFGGPLPFLIGRMTCAGPGGPFEEYALELLRLPLPEVASD